jgi:hypothetical protein
MHSIRKLLTRLGEMAAHPSAFDTRNTRSHRALNYCRQPRLATLAGVTSLAAATSPVLRETRLAPQVRRVN